MNGTVLQNPIKCVSFLSVRRNRILTILFLCIVCVIIQCWNIQDLNMIYVTSDEMGYWGVAAYLAGFDWSPVISNIYYYSYGYSLLLTPLFHLFSDPTLIYQSAIVLNGVMMAAVIPLAYKIGERLFPSCQEWVLILSAFCVSLYSGYILQASINRNECLLIFLFWLILYLVLQLHRKAPLWKFCLFAIFSVYIYMVHQRALGIMIAAGILILILLIGKHISWRQLVAFGITFCLMLLLHSVLKNYIKDSVWLNSTTSSANDFGSVSNRLGILFSSSGFLSFLRTLIGQVFYLGVASFILSYVGFIYLFPESIGLLRNSFKRESQIVAEKNPSSSHVIFFLLLCVIFTVLISALFMILPSRIDHVLYGRYNEFVIVPLILIALLSLSQCRHRKKLLIVSCTCCIVYVLCGIVSFYSIQPLATFAPISSPGIAWGERFFAEQWYLVVLVPFIVFTILIIFFNRNSSPKSHWMQYAAILLCTVAFVGLGRYPVTHTVLPAQQSNMLAIEGPKEYLEQNQISELYYYWDKDLENNYSYWDISYLQFMMPNEKIYPVHSVEELAALPNGTNILTLTSDVLNFDLHHSAVLKQVFERFSIWEKQASSPESPLSLPLPLSSFATQNGIPSMDFASITSNGQPGFLLYGPYMSVPTGSWKVNVNLDLISSKDAEIGWIDIYNQGTTIASRSLARISFKQNTLKMVLPFQLIQEAPQLEIRIFSNDDTILKITGIEISSN